MDIYVATLNPTIQTIAIIDYCNSIIWHEKFCGAGDFEIALPASAAVFETFKKDNLVYRRDSDTIMIVERLQLTTSEDSGDQVIVSGRSCDVLIERRIVWGQQTFEGEVCQCVEAMLNNNLISPTDSARKIDLIQIGSVPAATQIIQKQITGDNLLDSIVEILTSSKLGYRLKMEVGKLSGKLLFTIIQGTDRSEGNVGGNPTVKFSPEFDNLLISEYVLDSSKYKNTALVGGEGEGSARVYVPAGQGGLGIDRYELFVDARSTSSNDGEIPVETYLGQLGEEGDEKLAETVIVETFSGEIEDETKYSY